MFQENVSWMAEEKSVVPPINLREIDINVTNLCNLECIYCSYSSTPNKNEPALPADLIHRLLDEAASIGNRVVHFSGGEPVIRNDMPEFISHASSLAFKMRMHSNGALLTETKLKELWNAGLKRVLISLDGFEENHNYHRMNPNLYQKTIRGIENAVSVGYNVRVNSVATTRNIHEIPQLLPTLTSMGVATFSVFYCIPVGRGRLMSELMVPPTRWRRFIEEMKEMAYRHQPLQMEVTVEKVFLWEDEWSDYDLSDSGRGGGCLGFLNECNYVNILADGRVYPCVCFIDEAPPLGNIFKDSLTNILHDPQAWTYYWSLKKTNSTCRACAMLSDCQGGSRALSKFMKHDWFALDPRCTGDPHLQEFIPLCFMVRENIVTRTHSGFAEQISPS